MKPALIRQHGATGPPGLLAEWMAEREIPGVVFPSYLGFPSPPPEDYSFVASLGSASSPKDLDEPAVAAELAYLERALAEDVPVLGLCFGGQALAAVLGGTVEPAERPELGWHEVETRDPEQIPPGPWLQWHYDRFTFPEEAEQLAVSPTGAQAFRHGSSLGVQFHPESRIERVAVWARKDAERLKRYGISDGEALLETGREHQAAAVESAFALFDAFWTRASHPVAAERAGR